MAISFLRTGILYIVILFSVRLMGKRQISQLQTSELVVMLLISDLAVIPMQDGAQPLASGLIPIILLVVCEIFLSYRMLKSEKLRHLICGKPVTVIQNGAVQQQNLQLLRMSVDELLEQLRQKDVFALEEVAYAVVETNGALSVCKYPQYDMLTPHQAGLQVEKGGIDIVVLQNGKENAQALRLVKKTPYWLTVTLHKENISPEDIYFMTVNTAGGYRIIPKEAPHEP